MIVYQTDSTGLLIGTTEADESPREPGVFLIPRLCVETSPPSLARGQQARWNGTAWSIEAIPPAPPVPVPTEPVAPHKLYKATVWRRVSDEEAEALDAALLAAPPRLRRLYDAATVLDTLDPDFDLLLAGITQALGEERAAIVLAPEF